MTAIESRIDTLAPVAGLSVTLTNGVLSVIIDRPESLNSVTTPVLAGIADAMEWAGADQRVKVVRLGGAGRGFCSGAGMSADDVSGSGGPGTEIIAEANRAVRAITALPRPVVAVVHGPAAGVGVSLALACDLVLASDTAFFMLAFTKVGLMPDGGASALVAAAIGRTRAMRMALLAERLPAADALAAGLVSAVYPADQFDDEVDKVVSALAAGPGVAFAKTKEAINAATLTELDAALDRELQGQAVLLKSRDFIEGATAFQQRRTPNFTDTL
ncbi:enoyl-CoA hydratase [Mycobacterium noviomagense]|uniref:Enoyl-CoA hydratase n=1 Tax=Mycobacterium noviomagense TaxID=459858 RepID=A0A7I7P9K9_9MYCO|nr:enoyl-CoA hydratase [Mycobacterium noviomagense]ORB18160.1 enoyl-CoA hydratase [Mycobacterium noviomagense]BBY05245.1 enoyl-CoA hydratase [Mycobacterium noviomagense]